MNPKNAATYNTRCLIYEKMGEVDRALRDCDKAVEIDSLNSAATNNRTNIFKNSKPTGFERIFYWPCNTLISGLLWQPAIGGALGLSAKSHGGWFAFAISLFFWWIFLGAIFGVKQLLFSK